MVTSLAAQSGRLAKSVDNLESARTRADECLEMLTTKFIELDGAEKRMEELCVNAADTEEKSQECVDGKLEELKNCIEVQLAKF